MQNNIVQQQYVQTDTGPSHSRVPTTIRTANSDRKSEPIAPAVDADRTHVQFPGRRFPPRHFRFRSPSTLWRDARKTRHLLFLPRKPIRRRHGTIEVWHVYKNLRFIILRATLYLMHTHGCAYHVNLKSSPARRMNVFRNDKINIHTRYIACTYTYTSYTILYIIINCSPVRYRLGFSPRSTLRAYPLYFFLFFFLALYLLQSHLVP